MTLSKAGSIGANGVDIRSARTIRAQNLDRIELSLFRNAIGAGANGASNMGTMAVTIRVGAVGEVRGEGSAPAKLLARVSREQD